MVVVTRCSSQGQHIYRQPIPVSQLVVEDLADGEVRMGSFRSAFGQGQTSRCTPPFHSCVLLCVRAGSLSTIKKNPLETGRQESGIVGITFSLQEFAVND